MTIQRNLASSPRSIPRHWRRGAAALESVGPATFWPQEPPKPSRPVPPRSARRRWWWTKRCPSCEKARASLLRSFIGCGAGGTVQILAVTQADGVEVLQGRRPADRAAAGYKQTPYSESFERTMRNVLHVSSRLSTDTIRSRRRLSSSRCTRRRKFGPPILFAFWRSARGAAAAKLSKDANSTTRNAPRWPRPAHRFTVIILNFVSLDRYRKLGITFVFNAVDRRYHYDGASWRELVAKFPAANETVEAKKRLDALTAKMAQPTAATK